MGCVAGEWKMSRSAMGNDVVVVGGGLVGLSLSMELKARGADVTVLERASETGRTPGQASWAAAGMLAAEDPFNPLELRELSRWSRDLYPAFLERIAQAGGGEVPFQTEWTRQYLEGGRAVELAEHSVEPRAVLEAVRNAVVASGVRICYDVPVEELAEENEAQVVVRSGNEEFRASSLVWANGAWFHQRGWVRPRKGQMMRVKLPHEMDTVHRAEDVYIVPRRFGPQAGTAVIGATVEDCGFDTTVHADALKRLQARAAELVHELRGAEVVESWAGLRPGSRTGLPVLSRLPGTGRQFVADGHFRNGILLAPATAVAIADLVEGKRPAIALDAFSAAAMEQGEAH